jgi:hypothetical protein
MSKQKVSDTTLQKLKFFSRVSCRFIIVFLQEEISKKIIVWQMLHYHMNASRLLARWRFSFIRPRPRVDGIGYVRPKTKEDPFVLIIKKYFNEHKAYFNLNCKEVYRFEWEFGERRERICAFIVNWLLNWLWSQ